MDPVGTGVYAVVEVAHEQRIQRDVTRCIVVAVNLIRWSVEDWECGLVV